MKVKITSKSEITRKLKEYEAALVSKSNSYKEFDKNSEKNVSDKLDFNMTQEMIEMIDNMEDSDFN